MFSHRLFARIPANYIITAIVLSLALLASGCNKKPVKVVPAVLVPTIESQPQPSPQDSQNTTPDTQAAPPETPASLPAQDAQKPKPKPRRPIPRKPIQQPAVTEAPKPEPPKPTAPDQSVQITADVPRAAVQSQRQGTEQLLRNSEGKLAHINRGLSDSEQGMLRQARNYISQSNQALQGGDIERAYNLAVKANLLSNELAK
jgi:hypothetical protein